MLSRLSQRVGGYTFAENPVRSFRTARILWSAAFEPAVLVASARPAGLKGEAFDIRAFGDRAVVAIDPDCREHWCLTGRGRHLRIDIVKGSLRAGPARLEFILDGLASLPPRLDALHALLGQLGIADPRRRSDAPDRRLPRLVEALRVLDALRAGASTREIGLALFDRPARDWPGDGEHLKSLVRRRVVLARRLAAGGPRDALAGRL